MIDLKNYVVVQKQISRGIHPFTQLGLFIGWPVFHYHLHKKP